MAHRPLVVLGDAHLGQSGGVAVSEALARLVGSHPQHEIVLDGDTLDLSWQGSISAPLESIAPLLRPHADLCAALAAHLRAGAPVTWVAGNHDVALGLPGARDALCTALGAEPLAPLSVDGWFARRGGIHIEHGHVYDPDNAPTHPLVPWAPETEPLGIALTRRLLAEGDFWEFAHAHETTFLSGIRRALRSYGAQGPRVIAAYYRTAAALWIGAGRSAGLARERAAGDAALEATAARYGIDVERLRALVGICARPTHHRRSATFQRLYLDRSLAILALLLGGAASFGPGRNVARALALAGAGYLGVSVWRWASRYRGTLEFGLREAAAAIAALGDARLVVLGHAHRPDTAPGYANPGSFGHAPPGERPYLVVAPDGGYDRRTV
jgi:hypothetical protein